MKNRSTWVQDVEEALRKLGGKSHLDKIYGIVKEIRIKNGSSLGNYRAWVRNAIYQNSRGKGYNLFNTPKIRSGIWLLNKKD